MNFIHGDAEPTRHWNSNQFKPTSQLDGYAIEGVHEEIPKE